MICGGGGGAPVIDDGTGALQGVEAVIDKDLTAALLAIAVGADRLVLLTDVDAVMRDFGTPRQAPVPQLHLDDLTRLTFPAGSMGPKIEACRRFVAATGHPAVIGSLADATGVLEGRTAQEWSRWPDHAHQEETLRLTERGHLTDRYGKAVELLGSDKLDVRLGAFTPGSSSRMTPITTGIRRPSSRSSVLLCASIASRSTSTGSTCRRWGPLR